MYMMIDCGCGSGEDGSCRLEYDVQLLSPVVSCCQCIVCKVWLSNCRAATSALRGDPSRRMDGHLYYLTSLVGPTDPASVLILDL